MANRFLDTNYYKSPFVRSLKGELKSLYSFIICDCDGAGIWNLDLQAAEMYTGFRITQQEFEAAFVHKNKAVDIGGGKFFFPDFIEHQYPGGLHDNNKAHKNFILTLKKFNLIGDDLVVKKLNKIIPISGNEAPLKDALKASHVMSSNGQVMVNKVESQKTLSKEDLVLFQSQLIQDTVFIEQVMQTRYIKELNVMLNWIKVFNVHICGEGKLDKDYPEYKRHFKNWIVKQDTSKSPPIGIPILTNNGNYQDTEKIRAKYGK